MDEILKDPAYPTAIWELEPHRSGRLPVAADRGGPLNISWEIHGEGPIKLLVSPEAIPIFLTFLRPPPPPGRFR